jgi:hypothetical protein
VENSKAGKQGNQQLKKSQIHKKTRDLPNPYYAKKIKIQTEPERGAELILGKQKVFYTPDSGNFFLCRGESPG